MNSGGRIQAHDDILAYDFKALVGGHISRWGTRVDVEAAREYWHDLLTFSQDALTALASTETISHQTRWHKSAGCDPRNLRDFLRSR